MFSMAWEREVLSATINDTNLVLNPKCDNPSSMKDMKPIAIYNVVYKN